MSKEKIYDSEIAPLMAKVISICQEHKIPMLSSFELDFVSAEESHLRCTSFLPSEEDKDLILQKAKRVFL